MADVCILLLPCSLLQAPGQSWACRLHNRSALLSTTANTAAGWGNLTQQANEDGKGGGPLPSNKYIFLFHICTAAGWGNLMQQADEDGKGGGPDPALSEEALARLMDRSHVFTDDLASGADAGAFCRVGVAEVAG